MLTMRDNSLTLIVEDNGKGLGNSNSIGKNGTNGLIGMKERATLIGGRLEIESKSGEGTTIYVKVPFSTNGQ
jgi:two-component system sensor kinase